MKYFVTGGAGCIGSELVARLLRENHEVTIYDNFSTGKKEHLEQLSGKKLHVINGDILDSKKLAAAMAGSDTVFHLAAHSTTKFQKGDTADATIKNNILGTYNVLEAMQLKKIKKIVFASSQAVYGPAAERLTEKSPLQPISFYGASKAACENLIQAFCSVYDMQCWIFRLANVVGGKSRKTGTAVVTDFVKKLREKPKTLEVLGDGKQTKSYITTDDSIDAMLFCLEKAKEKVNIFNVASKDVLTVDEIAEIVIKEMSLKGVKIMHTGGTGGWVGDVPKVILDMAKITALGWKPRYGSGEAVRFAAAAAKNM